MVTGKKNAITKAAAAKAKPSPATKGKGKGKAVPAKEPTPEPEVDEEEEEEEDDSQYDSDEDEENGGVSERGLKRLMELVGPEDLDELERAQLGLDEDDEEEDDEDDDEDEDEVSLPHASHLTPQEDNTILIDEADADALAVDELGSDVSLDEDAVPQRKVTHNNKPAMRILTEGIKMTNTPWPEHLIVSSKTIIDVDPSDDLQRETAFYKLALEAVPSARAQCAKHDILFTRPTDYYAEMVKSDEHMERVRTKLVEESQGIKKSEEAKKQRELKKYGKQIQHEKLKQREADKKSFNDKMAGVKRKRKEGVEIGDEGAEDDFGIHLDHDDDHRGGRGGAKGGKSKVSRVESFREYVADNQMPRHARDAKYSLGQSSRRAKQNTRESTNDFAGWGGDKKGGKGGKGGPKGAAARPGKSKRHSRRK
jgi:rRNA-processing protein EBP2